MSRYVLLRVDNITSERRSAADVADDLRQGLFMLETGLINGKPDAAYTELAVALLKRSLIGVSWVASGVWV